MSDLRCDHFTDCRGVVTDQGDDDRTIARARAGGWHIFHGSTHGGINVTYVLCPKCVGRHGRVPKPEVLEGQEPLF